ncbi:MAG: GrpB family protein [Lachnospiraceae bacterium]|nr:GrpB family protein [Lachnospiraceae bacterium]
MKTDKVVVVPYDEKWEIEFGRIKEELLLAIGSHILAIEHVGSTAVKGLAAKPVIDVDVIIKDYGIFEAIKEKLGQIGYIHEGDLGIKDRQAFKYENKKHLMKHHLYICPEYSEELKRHIAFRDYLRLHKDERDWYGETKMLAAKRYPQSIENYMLAKNDCVAEIINRLRC